ncbi:MAG: hypothetical protein ACREBR_01720 [bacterium]
MKKATIQCEGDVTRLDRNGRVVVIRDVAERLQRFEAEKNTVSETTARQEEG